MVSPEATFMVGTTDKFGVGVEVEVGGDATGGIMPADAFPIGELDGAGPAITGVVSSLSFTKNRHDGVEFATSRWGIFNCVSRMLGDNILTLSMEFSCMLI